MISQSTLTEECKCSDVHSFLTLDQTVLLFISLLKHINKCEIFLFALGVSDDVQSMLFLLGSE